MKKILLLILILLPQLASASVFNSTSLVGYWTFDGKDTPGRVLDRSGQGNTGYVSGISTSTFYTTGKIGQGLNFDGVNDTIALISNPISSFSSPVTVCSWINPSTLSVDVTAITLFTDSNNYLDLGIISGGGLMYSHRSGGVDFGKQKASVISANIWSHICGVWDGAAVSLYKNGTVLTSLANNTYSANGNNIGQRSVDRYMNGSLDDVRVYSRALSASEIAQLYNNGSLTPLTPPSVTNSLVGWWTFDGRDVPNGVAFDRSSSGNKGNLTSISTSTFYTVGKIGQGFNFDGVDDQVKLTSDPIAANTVTVCAWFNTASPNSRTAIVGNTKFSFGVYATNNRMELTSDNGATQTFSLIGSISANNWFHACAIRESGGRGNIYINGVFNTAGVTGTPSSGTGIAIGNSTAGSGVFIGKIDDVRIYNTVLATSSIQQLYNNGSVVYITPPSITRGLLGWWTMDGKDSPGRAIDKSGNGNHGYFRTIATSTFYTTGKIGQAVLYSGVSGSGTSFTQLNPGTTFTYAGWIYRPKGTISTFENLMSNSSSIGIWMTSDGKIDFDAGGVHKNNTALTQGVWHHFVVVDNATAVTFYLDGVADGTATVVTNMFFDGMGCDSGTGAECFTGKQDDVRLYSRALTATEVSQLYNNGLAVTNQ